MLPGDQKHNSHLLALDGDDLRKLPLYLRKTNLAHLLARSAYGIHLAPFEQGEIGPDLFKGRLLLGLKAKKNIGKGLGPGLFCFLALNTWRQNLTSMEAFK
jgi:hypothetical protein